MNVKRVDAATISEADLEEIKDRRTEKGAAQILAKKFHTSSARIYRIWKQTGVFDQRRNASPVPVPVSPVSTIEEPRRVKKKKHHAPAIGAAEVQRTMADNQQRVCDLARAALAN